MCRWPRQRVLGTATEKASEKRAPGSQKKRVIPGHALQGRGMKNDTVQGRFRCSKGYRP